MATGGSGMDGKRGLQRLFRWPRVPAEPGAVDAADMGTAYGMELSIDEANGNSATAEPDTPRTPAKPPESQRPKRR
jgi:hypothetical protein